jgi:protein-tyrosine kinase
VLQGRRHGGPPRTILVTSALEGEGKSTVAANLAVAIARSVREHVLLMDCDLRRPSLHELFGTGPRRGLSDYLRAGVALPELLVRCGEPKLSILPAGPQAPDAAELLASERMQALLAEARERYDDRFIILDSTPLLSAADPAILAAQVDAVLLVVRSGRAQAAALARLVETLGRERFLGVVFNAARPAPGGRHPSAY